ncbi:glycosyltransferase family 2 protein, partial [bacterium]|nr:glycosyltransferase family 2 protein [bacterium]
MQAEYCFVIPCYNRFEYLRECIESLRSQTVRTWEAVLVDDGSTDGDIASVVAGFSDSRLKWIRHEKKCGPGAARNTGFRNTDSKLIVQVDGDDRISPDYLAHMGKLFKDDEMLDCAYPDLQLFGAEQGRWCMDGKTDGTLLLRQTIPCGSVMMKRQLWERVGGYDEAPELVFGNEDWEFWLRAVEKGFQVRHLCEPLYDYR